MRTDKLFFMETTYTWGTIENECTRMTLRNRGKPTGFSKLLTPIIPLAMKQANRKDLEALNKPLEK